MLPTTKKKTNQISVIAPLMAKKWIERMSEKDESNVSLLKYKSKGITGRGRRGILCCLDYFVIAIGFEPMIVCLEGGSNNIYLYYLFLVNKRI